MKKQKKVLTIGAFDLAKGVGMLCIIVGHTMYRYDIPMTGLNIIIRILGIGLMPMFFLISGIGVRKMNEKKLLKKMKNELLCPYLYITISVVILFPLFHYLAFRGWQGAISETVRTGLAYFAGSAESGKEFLGIKLYECSVAWFFLALFWGNGILNFILVKIKEKYQLLTVCLFILIGFGCTIIDFWYLCIPQGCFAVGYIYFGYRIKRSGWLEKRCVLWHGILLAGISFFEIVWGEVNLAYSTFKWGVIDYLGAGLAGLSMLRINLWLNRFEGKVSEIICKIGRYTYYAMCVHSVEINCIPWYLLSEKFKSCPYFGFLLEISFRSCILIIGCIILSKISRYIRKKRKETCIKKSF